MAADDISGDAFAIRTGSDHGDYVVAVRGEVDSLTAPKLRHELDRSLSSGARRVVIDLSAVRFIDSTGLHAIITIWHHAQDRGLELLLRRPPPPVNRSFEVAGLDRDLPFAD